MAAVPGVRTKDPWHGRAPERIGQNMCKELGSSVIMYVHLATHSSDDTTLILFAPCYMDFSDGHGFPVGGSKCNRVIN